MATRRRFLRDTSFAAAAGFGLQRQRFLSGKAFDQIPPRVTTLEREHGGRIGLCILDTGTGKAVGNRIDERFPMCSTFKFPLAAAVLQRVDQGKESLTRAVTIPPKPLLPVSPETEEHAGGQMTLADLCQAVLVRSDNTAANVLLDVLGGPPAVNAFLRSIGDGDTRLDRNEPSLNTSLAGDPRDTTTPRAMAADLQRLLLGKALKPASRLALSDWMEACVTGLDRLRKNVPESWRVADRTGSNGEHTTNDIAVFWPTNREPIAVTVYLTQCPGPETKRNAVIAEVGRFVREAILFG